MYWRSVSKTPNNGVDFHMNLGVQKNSNIKH